MLGMSHTQCSSTGVRILYITTGVTVRVGVSLSVGSELLINILVSCEADHFIDINKGTVFTGISVLDSPTKNLFLASVWSHWLVIFGFFF